MLTFAKRLLFVFFLILVVLFVYQNRGPLSQTTQFSFGLHWWGSEDNSAPEGGPRDGTSEESPDDGTPVAGQGDDTPESGLQFQTPEIHNLLLFLVFFFLGILAAGVHNVYERIARRIDVRKRDKRIRQLEKELEELRAELVELNPPAPPAEPIPEPGTAPAEKLAPPQPPAPPGDAPTL